MNDKHVWLNHYPDDISTDVEIPNTTLPQILQNTSEEYPQNDAILFYQQKMSYKELNMSVQAFASSIQQSGINKGDRVAIMLPNCPQYVISFYGVLAAGAIVTQINPMLVERELQYILADSGAQTVVVLDMLYPRVKAIQQNTGLKNIIVVSLQPNDQTYKPDISFYEFMKVGNGIVSPVDTDPEHDIAVLQYTGGTTGRPKGAMLTHRNLIANNVQAQEFFKNDVEKGKERCLIVLPFFHVFGMSACMNFSIFNAASMVLLPRFDVEEVLHTIKAEKPTIFPGVPTMFIAILNHPNATDYGIDCIKVCNSGGAPMPVEVLKAFEEKTGSKIVEGFGMSESGPVTHSNPLFAERKTGSVGIPYPSTDFKIVDIADGKLEVPVGEVGELIVSGPQIMKGYWNMTDETMHTLRDGWLYTGDIARMDEDGYLYIVDRKKDMIIASGFNIYPRDIEEVLYEHPSIQEAVVVGVQDAYRGETVKAFIVLKQGEQTNEQDIINYCKDHMASYKVPTIIEFKAELPKTTVGKILRRALRENNLT
ncbi:long-chain fatty acid--CoA ligase [Cytobacillus sp. IB215316]|uniref:long-chain-fatty-acid--CoA ligase n=1 Tax=Cytobacillus sp. IB215316 TaxID=3097354 RepID=UPI002A15FBA0|nr:long-chain fatty acid--CoA ligase [Cytobacillus sp. IB215316]MDX8360223.1 long-chain fatty acid--CoA ligase [Cytobacillus sp. IB215316]